MEAVRRATYLVFQCRYHLQLVELQCVRHRRLHCLLSTWANAGKVVFAECSFHDQMPPEGVGQRRVHANNPFSALTELYLKNEVQYMRLTCKACCRTISRERGGKGPCKVMLRPCSVLWSIVDAFCTPTLGKIHAMYLVWVRHDFVAEPSMYITHRSDTSNME
jgi:hypothetical protein